MSDLTSKRCDTFSKLIEKFLEISFYLCLIIFPFSTSGTLFLGILIVLCYILKKFLFIEGEKDEKEKFNYIRPFFFLCLVLLFSFSLSLFYSNGYLKYSLKEIGLWICYIIIFFAIIETFPSQEKLNKIIFLLCIIGIIVGIDGVIQEIIGRDILGRNPVLLSKVYGVTGPFSHNIKFAAYILFILSLMVAISLSNSKTTWFKRFIKKRYILLGVYFLILSLLFTFCRGGWLGMLFSLLIIGFFSKRYKVIFISIAIIITLFGSSPKFRQRIFVSSSILKRLKLWKIGLEMSKENLFFGKGIGTYEKRIWEYEKKLNISLGGKSKEDAHNCYLQILAETGLLGLLSFIFFIGFILFKSIKTFNFYFKKFPSDFNLYILLGLIAGTCGFLVFIFFERELYSSQFSIFFWIILGLIICVKKVIEEKSI